MAQKKKKNVIQLIVAIADQKPMTHIIYIVNIMAKDTLLGKFSNLVRPPANVLIGALDEHLLGGKRGT